MEWLESAERPAYDFALPEAAMEEAIHRALESAAPALHAEGAGWDDVRTIIEGTCAGLGLAMEDVALVGRICQHTLRECHTVTVSSREHGLLSACSDPVTDHLARDLYDGGVRQVPAAVLLEAARVLHRQSDPDQWDLAKRYEGLVRR